jgi:hypothetical protein
MTTKEPTRSWDPILWPCFLGGALTPVAGAVLENWLSPVIAGGAAGAIVSIAVLLLLQE